MANSLSNKGEEYMLFGDGSSDGAIARLTTAVLLYTSASTPNKDGTGFTEVANGNGYVTGGTARTIANWTFSIVSTRGQVVMADVVYTASGGQILNIAGAYLVDTGANVLAWWERTPVTLDDTDTLTLDDLTIRL